ncbi:MAG TPA: alpha/beta hydrolase [Marmoricola sp.]
MSLRRSASHGMLLGIVAGVLIVLLVFAWMIGYTLLDKSSKDSSSSSPSATSSGPMPKTSAALARFYDQSLTWKKCQGGECSWLTVPLDYADPDGKTIKIAVNMVAAKDKSPIGDLVVNPGGPGQSGMQYAAAASYVFRSALTNHFNIVGFDPRGIGASDPLKCWGTKDMDAFVAADPAPQTPAARAAMDRQVHAFGESCLKNSGALAEHMSTEEVARDVDILRAALKQPKLDYFGASYGTFLGATYANLFPKNVGRMVLDGALDPTLSNEQLNLAQAHGFEVAMRSYIKDCVSKGHCVLGNSVEAGVRTVKALIASIRRSPLPTNDPDRPLTVGLASLGIFMPLYDKTWWGQLTSALTQAIQQHRGSGLLAMADLYASRDKTGYMDNSLDALYNVNCLDDGASIPTSAVAKYVPRFEKASPMFGDLFAYSLSTCHDWPIKSAKRPHALHAKGSPPILVMGTTRDPATPLAWAKALAKQLDNGVLVVRNGDGHTGYNQGNICADDAVENFLVSDKVPADGTRC